jgi:hypothetical protein
MESVIQHWRGLRQEGSELFEASLGYIAKFVSKKTHQNVFKSSIEGSGAKWQIRRALCFNSE